MPTNRLTVAGDIGGITFSSTLTRSADGQIGHQFDTPQAWSGTLTTRTDDFNGTITMTSGSHAISTGDTIDLFFVHPTTGVNQAMYGATVGTVSGTSVPFTTAVAATAGAVLPTADDPITGMTQVVVDSDWDADKLVAIGTLLPNRGVVVFYSSGDTVELVLALTAAEMWFWMDGGTEVNPLAGHVIDYMTVTQVAEAVATFRCGILYDSTV